MSTTQPVVDSSCSYYGGYLQSIEGNSQTQPPPADHSKIARNILSNTSQEPEISDLGLRYWHAKIIKKLSRLSTDKQQTNQKYEVKGTGKNPYFKELNTEFKHLVEKFLHADQTSVYSQVQNQDAAVPSKKIHGPQNWEKDASPGQGGTEGATRLGVKEIIAGAADKDELLVQISSSFQRMAELYKSALNQVFLNTPQSSLREKTTLFLATLTDKEIQAIKVSHPDLWERLCSYYTPPKTDSTLLLLTEFLKSQTENSNKVQEYFKKLVDDLCQVIFMLNVANLSEVHASLMRELVNVYLKNRVLSLSENEMILLPGGWLNHPKVIEGHFMLYGVHRISDTQFLKFRINSHALPEMQTPSDDDDNQIRVEMEIIEVSEIESFISEILELDEYIKQSAVEKNLKNGFYEQWLQTILESGRWVSSSDYMTVLPINLEVQNDAFNCCFMAIYIFYEYLFKSSMPEANDQAVKARLAFRNKFQKFILKN